MDKSTDPVPTRDASTLPIEPTLPYACTAKVTSPAGYEIMLELGRGGMGVVYKAWQASLKRTVALKMILSGTHAGQKEVARFRAEAETVARFQHPHVVQIYEVGEHEGRPFFSLEFVEGGSLDHKLKATPLPVEEAAKVTETLARTIHAAHLLGIVHRDLKPANILLMRDGTPKISDFGLAKQLDGDGPLTVSGAVMGTPSYMSPEQAQGKTHAIGPASDIWALGAVMYELLTGRPPFRAAAPLDTIMQVITDAPLPPSLLQRTISRDLETICLKCLEKEPHHRYATAEHLADDLRRYIDGEPLSIRASNLADRFLRSLSQSRLRTEFHAWGNSLLACAAIVFGAHLLLHWLYHTWQPVMLIVAVDCVQIALIGAAFGMVQWRRTSPIIAEEHRLWMLAIAYLMACTLVRVINQQGLGIEEVYALRDYPYWSILASLLFFMLGVTYWGYCYLFSAAFGVLGLMIHLYPRGAVLAFGGLWSICLCALGLHLRRLGQHRS